ncbi:MAG TPA: hypothetical protein VGK32_11985 [Vicinamibacterales bacterium]
MDLTARAHVEAARAQSDREVDRTAERDVPKAPASTPMRGTIVSPDMAIEAVRQASDQILAQPDLAARAQANSQGGNVLNMLR